MICIPVVATTNETALEQMGRCFREADVVELRIDLIQDVDLPLLLSKRQGKVLVTNRKKEEGGKFSGTEDERVSLLCKAVAEGAELVDIELATASVLVKRLSDSIAKYEGRTQLVLSYHNHTETPSEGELLSLLDESIACGAPIIKIVTMAQSVRDNLRILNLLTHAKRGNRKIIAFCMGETGKISRVMAPFFGSYLSFAALERGAKSAPGQLTVTELKEIMRVINNDGFVKSPTSAFRCILRHCGVP
ncbi:MAG: type I 3-dehydroquinate dehydratase [Thermodesulfobacteriota bacterium]|nr:type I 3-dehydroquinate dehydratase [Thermodesulfobacteriota bacterium]